MDIYLVIPHKSSYDDIKAYHKLCRAYEYATASIRRDVGAITPEEKANVNFDMWIGDVDIELDEPGHIVRFHGYSKEGIQGTCTIKRLPIAD